MRSKVANGSAISDKVAEIPKKKKTVPWAGQKRIQKSRAERHTKLEISKRSENGGKAEYIATDQDREVVSILAATGYHRDRIAWYLGVSPMTLTKLFKEELEKSLEKMNALVANSLYKQAINGNLGAICFWLKNRNPRFWSEQPKIESLGQAETRQMDYTRLTLQEQRQLRQLMERALGVPQVIEGVSEEVSA